MLHISLWKRKKELWKRDFSKKAVEKARIFSTPAVEAQLLEISKVFPFFHNFFLYYECY